MNKLDICIWLTFAMLLIALFVAFAGFAPPFVLTTTRYAPGYSEERFQKLKIRTPEKTVRLQLGNPIFEYTNSAGD